MSILHSRITQEDYLAMPGHHPAVAEAAPVTPTSIPLAHVSYDGDTVLYGTLHPLYTADGAVVPAYADVTYPDSIPAGRA